MSTEIKRMDLTEFVETGYLHEINRCLLHPLGLALEYIREEDGTISRFGGVWDYRDDPEGIIFGELDVEKIENVRREIAKRYPKRTGALGYWKQEVDEEPDEPDSV